MRRVTLHASPHVIRYTALHTCCQHVCKECFIVGCFLFFLRKLVAVSGFHILDHKNIFYQIFHLTCIAFLMPFPPFCPLVPARSTGFPPLLVPATHLNLFTHSSLSPSANAKNYYMMGKKFSYLVIKFRHFSFHIFCINYMYN